MVKCSIPRSDYSALREHCTCYPMLDQMVQVERVPQSRSVQVFGCSNTLQVLELYFENTNRSGGGEVESAKEYKECAIITFKDKTTLDSILARDHTLSEQKLVIRKYFACLGVLPPDYDDSLPGGPIPCDIPIKLDDQAVLAFLLQTSNLRKAIENNLRAVECQVSWPGKANGPLILQCTLNRNTDAFYRMSKGWEGQVKQRIDTILSKLSSEKVTVVSEIWNQFHAKISEVKRNQDSERLTITLSEPDSSCIIAGEKTRAKEVLDELEEMVEMVTKEHEFSQRIVTDKVLLKENWQKLILIGPVLEKVKKNYPKVKIGFLTARSTTLCFEGRYAEIQEAKKHVQSSLRDIPRRVITVSATTKTLLNKNVLREQIVRRMKGRRLVLEASDQVHGVCIYTVDERDLETGIKAIHEVIKEHTMNFRAGKAQELGRTLKEIERTLNGKVSYEINDNLLELSVFWEAEKDVMAKINSIVKDPVKKMTFSVSPGMIRLLKAHLMDKLSAIFQQYKSCDCNYDFDGTSGITLACVQSQFDKIHSAFMAVIKGVCHAENKVAKPGFRMFLSIQKGRDRLKALEHRHRICIEIKGQCECPMLSLYAVSERDMRATVAEIKTIADEECMEEKIQSERDIEAIANLDDAQMSGICALQRGYDVEINTRNASTRGITVEGLTKDVAEVKNKILDIIRETEHRIRDSEEGRILSKQVQWKYLPHGKETFIDYPDDLNAVIEKAFDKNLGSVQFKVHRDFIIINFNDMQETKHGSRERKTVKRQTKEYGPQVPDSWAQLKGSDPYYCFDLNPSSQEYQKVAQNLASTGGALNIQKIQRVQNKTLYLQYQVYKKERDQVNGSTHPNERVLWHGTSEDTVNKICAQGFNRSYCGKNATAIGAGSYFAVNASYSLSPTYSPQSPSTGFRYIFQARVVTGLSTRGNSGLRDPPPKDPRRPDILFDSVCDNPARPSMFVVFSDPAAYPEYIVVIR